MSIDYFLNSKQKHEILEIYFNEILNIYTDLIKNTELQQNNIYYNEEDNDFLKKIKQMYEEQLKNYKQQLNETIETCKIFEDLSQELCEHKYIVDLIDISPDKSTTIEYCEICGYTKKE